MPTNHVSIQKSTSALPDDTGSNSFSTQRFDAPGLNTSERPFLSYRVNPGGGSVKLRIVLNSETIVDETFDSDPIRSVLYIFDTGILERKHSVIPCGWRPVGARRAQGGAVRVAR